MNKLVLILALALGLTALQARQNMSHAAPGMAGFPDVIGGDKLRFGTMVVELFGIRAPKPGMICRAGSIEFHCGTAAAQALDRMIENYAIKCRQVSDTQIFPMLTACSIGKTDLNRLLLRAGWALVDMGSCDSHPDCATYLRDQAFAKEHRKGMWTGTPPRELVARAAKPQPVTQASAPEKANFEESSSEEGASPHIAQAPFGIDLAAELERANKPDTTLLSFLSP